MDASHSLTFGRGPGWGGAETKRLSPGASGRAGVDSDVQVSRRSGRGGGAEVRRLDVTRGSEKNRRPESEQSRTREDASEGTTSSLRDRERTRELFAKDMAIRVAEAALGMERARLRGSPSFEVEQGPLGRVYAVGEGVRYELEPREAIEQETEDPVEERREAERPDAEVEQSASQTDAERSKQEVEAEKPALEAQQRAIGSPLGLAYRKAEELGAASDADELGAANDAELPEPSGLIDTRA